MKFRSERDALVDMLATAGRAVGGRGGSSPVLLGLLLSCTGNALSVTGTDLDLTIQVSDEVIGIDDGSCVIPSRLATDIVRRLEPGAVTVEDEGDQVTISAARSTFRLHTYPVVEFPPVGKTAEPTTHLSEASLGEAVRQVVRAASHDDGRPLLTGVLLAHVDGFIRMVATDSYRMAMRDLADTDTIPGEEDLLVPARALSELQRLPTGTIAEGAETSRVGVAASSNEITFWQGKVQISTRLLEGRYPDYKQLIPDSYPNRLHLGKESFLAALRRVQLLVPRQHDAGAPRHATGRRRPECAEPGRRRRGGGGRRRLHRRGPRHRVQPVVSDRRRRGGDGRRGDRRDGRRVAGGDGARRGGGPIPLSADAGAGVLRGPRRAVSLRHVELADFRAFHTAQLSPEPEGTTAITGANGTGKTSVLEALAYLGTRRSFRGAPPEAMVRTGAQSAIVRAEFDTPETTVLVEAEIKPVGRSRTRVNRKDVNGRKALAGAAPCTVFSPDDLALISGGPAGRRDLLDDTLALLDAEGRARRTRPTACCVSAPRCCASRAAGSTRT